MNTTTEPITALNMPTENLSFALDPMLEQVLQRVRLRARRRVLWLRKVWTEVGNADNPGSSIHLEVDGYLNNVDIPSNEYNWYSSTESLDELNTAILKTESALAGDTDSRLSSLCEIFGLNEAETDLLHTCLAFALEPNLGRVYAYLNDHNGRGFVTETLAARLFGHGYCLPIGADSSLKRWELITEHPSGPGEPIRFELNIFIRNWLIGRNDPDEILTGIARILPPHTPLPNWPLDETLIQITRLLETRDSPCIRVFVVGAEGSGRRTFAATLAARLGLDTLGINSDRISDTRWPMAYMHAQRHAYLYRQALTWQGTTAQEKPWPRNIPAFQLQFVTGEVDEFLPPEEDFFDLRVELPPLSITQQRQLWLAMVPAAHTWPESMLDHLARRRQTTIGQILTVARAPHSAGDALEVINAASRRRLGTLAQALDSDFRWEDLILPTNLRQNLEDFIYEATERVSLWEQPETQRLFPQGRGLLALFTGPPGTGKTMAAQVIANVLQMDLYRVDLSTLVSKYVGETSKNIERILSRARRMDAVLFFDEADALFGKRTEIKDAHDRFANTDTNYLLQAIEQYPGIAVLASNRKANIDTGFTRRLRYILDFPKPDVPQRLQLWQRIVGELCGQNQANTLRQELSRLAEKVEITGAQIKSAVLSALYIARREKTNVTLSHLLRGIERELFKEGRGLGRQAQEILKH